MNELKTWNKFPFKLLLILFLWIKNIATLHPRVHDKWVAKKSQKGV